jgi:hypothetical protein
MARNDFQDFADRFVRMYWQNVIDNNHKLPPYEPVDQTIDEVLADTKVSTSQEIAIGQPLKVCVLRMFASSGSTSRFVFATMAGRWKLLQAFANDETDEHRCDMLDEYYGQYFRESLERITALATGGAK